ncbi:hypothetical protein EDC01DRAFT_776043 [Geopyxis carbonaria]|nr:hypothetical protein EDC01DRAFT_776043 [Geopyxis carbonaria]
METPTVEPRPPCKFLPQLLPELLLSIISHIPDPSDLAALAASNRTLFTHTQPALTAAKTRLDTHYYPHGDLVPAAVHRLRATLHWALKHAYPRFTAVTLRRGPPPKCTYAILLAAMASRKHAAHVTRVRMESLCQALRELDAPGLDAPQLATLDEEPEAEPEEEHDEEAEYEGDDEAEPDDDDDALVFYQDLVDWVLVRWAPVDDFHFDPVYPTHLDSFRLFIPLLEEVVAQGATGGAEWRIDESYNEMWLEAEQSVRDVSSVKREELRFWRLVLVLVQQSL